MNQRSGWGSETYGRFVGWIKAWILTCNCLINTSGQDNLILAVSERLADVSYSSLWHVQPRVKVSFSMKNRWGRDCQMQVVVVAVKRIVSGAEVLTNSQICGIIVQTPFESRRVWHWNYKIKHAEEEHHPKHFELWNPLVQQCFLSWDLYKCNLWLSKSILWRNQLCKIMIMASWIYWCSFFYHISVP